MKLFVTGYVKRFVFPTVSTDITFCPGREIVNEMVRRGTVTLIFRRFRYAMGRWKGVEGHYTGSEETL